MATDRPAETLAYHAGDDTSSNTAWHVLRLALILWASLVLIRHATYWGGQVLDGQTAFQIHAAGDNFPYAEIDAMAEGAILFAVLVIAIAFPIPTPRILAAIRLLCLLFILLVLADLVRISIDLLDGTRGEGTGRRAMRLIWLAASKIQLLVVPAVAVATWRRTLNDRK